MISGSTDQCSGSTGPSPACYATMLSVPAMTPSSPATPEQLADAHPNVPNSLRTTSPARRVQRAGACLLVCALVAVALAGCKPRSESGSASSPQPLPSSALRSLRAQTIHYVALGDSYASAPGVSRSKWAKGCKRSTNNYPGHVALAVQADSFDDRTCSGAQTIHATTAQPKRNGQAQIEAVTKKTTLVTLNFGGNDQRLFYQLIRTCTQLAEQNWDGSPCADHFAANTAASNVPKSTRPTDLLEVADRSEQAMVDLVRAVRHRAPKAQIMVVGYPLLVPRREPTGGCDQVALARGDFAYVHSVNQRLNDALAAAARRTGADYIDVERASRGHDICSHDPWINDSTSNVGKAAAYHPFLAEQQAVAHLVLRALD